MAGNEIRILITAQDKGAKKAIQDVTGVTEKSGAQFETFMGKARKVAGALGLVVTAGKAIDLTFKAGFERLMTIEDAEKRMTQMGLSTQEVDRLMAGLTETVTGTAFRLDDGADVMARFISSGMDLDTVNDRLRMTADTAAHAQAPLADIGNIFERIQSEGKLTGETLRMLQIRGVPALELLASAAGVTAAEMRDMISRGQVDADAFFGLWETGSQGFGENMIRIEGAAQSMGDTTSGALENLEAAFARLGATVGERSLPAVRAFADMMKEDIDQGIKNWEMLFGFFDRAAEQYDELAGTFAGTGDHMDRTWNVITGGAHRAEEGTKFFARAARDAADASGETSEALDELAAEIDAARDALNKLAGQLFDTGREMLNLADKQDALSEAVERAIGVTKDEEATQRDKDKALRDVAKRVLDVTEAEVAMAESQREVTDATKRGREALIDAMVQMGYSEAAAGSYADELGLIPSDVSTTIGAVIDFESLRRAEIAIDHAARARYVPIIGQPSNLPGGQQRVMATGGIVGVGTAAGGGPRGRDVLINEVRPEVVSLPDGSRVIPSVDQATDRNQLGGGGPTEVVVRFDFTGADDAFMDFMRRALSVRGMGHVLRPQ
jgi:tape measure domain-containing protein